MTKNEFIWMLRGMEKAFQLSEEEDCEELVERIITELENLGEI